MSSRRSRRAFVSSASVSGIRTRGSRDNRVLAAGDRDKWPAFQRRGLVNATSGNSVGLPASGKSLRNGK